MEKVIFFNEAVHGAMIATLKGTVSKMKKAIQNFNSMGIGTFKQEDFHDLFYDTDNFLFKKIMKDKPTEFAGLKIDKKKFFNDYLEKPYGYNELIKEIEQFWIKTQKDKDSYWQYESIKSYINFFSIKPDGEFEINQNVIDKAKSKNEVKITSEKAQTAYEIAVTLKDLLTEQFLRKSGIVNQETLLLFFRGILPYEEYRTKLNIDYFKYLDSN